MRIDIRQLKYFDALYRLRSFVKAAEEQRVTQSALTKSIKSLEEKLGTTLFDRTTHSVLPTAMGEDLIAHARDVLGTMNAFTEQSRIIEEGNRGAVNIGAGPYPMVFLLREVLRQFSRDYPMVQVNVHSGGPKVLLDKLLARELDFVISDISKFESLSQTEKLDVIEFPKEPLVVVHHPDHPIKGHAFDVEIFSQHAWALPKQSPYFERLMRPMKSAQSLQRPLPQYALENISLCIELVREGGVLSVVPVGYGKELENRYGLCLIDMPLGFESHDGIHMLKGKSVSRSTKLALSVVQAQAAKRKNHAG